MRDSSDGKGCDSDALKSDSPAPPAQESHPSPCLPAEWMMDGAVVHNMLLPLGSAELFLEDLVVINPAEQRGQVNSACGGSAPPGTQSLT